MDEIIAILLKSMTPSTSGLNQRARSSMLLSAIQKGFDIGLLGYDDANVTFEKGRGWLRTWAASLDWPEGMDDGIWGAAALAADEYRSVQSFFLDVEFGPSSSK